MNGDDDDVLAGLMRAALTGDEAAYADFLRRAAALVRRSARRKLAHDGTGLDPEDIVQETLLAIHLKRHTWRPDGPILPWLFAIARYKLIDAFRRHGRRVEVRIEDFADILAAPEQAETASDRDIERALDSLPGRQRGVVAAIAVDGRSIRETAGTFGISQSAVRVALHRGLAALTAKFERN
ncbi:MAG TPA: sigma-70 family RNA polymerase sigma factor [Arenibaculum sp.]|nr:sigma-70 family RNA polymerase sigma factor [Arenibaculum sp.]